MNTADYVILAAIALSAILGATRGLLREVVAFVTWVTAVIVAWHFSDVIEPHLGGLLAGASVKPWVARLVILFLVLLLGALIGAIVSQFVRLSIFSGVDRLGGFAFGGLRGTGPCLARNAGHAQGADMQPHPHRKRRMRIFSSIATPMVMEIIDEPP